MNRAMKVVEFAQEIYWSGIDAGLSPMQSMKIAKRLGGNHIGHIFTSNEIRIGICGCKGCKKKVKK